MPTLSDLSELPESVLSLSLLLLLVMVSTTVPVLELATDFSEEKGTLVMVTPWLRAPRGSGNLKCSVPGP